MAHRQSSAQYQPHFAHTILIRVRPSLARPCSGSHSHHICIGAAGVATAARPVFLVTWPLLPHPSVVRCHLAFMRYLIRVHTPSYHFAYRIRPRILNFVERSNDRCYGFRTTEFPLWRLGDMLYLPKNVGGYSMTLLLVGDF